MAYKLTFSHKQKLKNILRANGDTNLTPNGTCTNAFEKENKYRINTNPCWHILRYNFTGYLNRGEVLRYVYHVGC